MIAKSLVGILAAGATMGGLLTLAGPAAADAQVTDPCNGARIRNVLVSGSVWLADCGSAVRRSADRGATWQPTTFFANHSTIPDGTGGFLSTGVYIHTMDAAGATTINAISPSMDDLALDGTGQLWGLRCPPEGDPGHWTLFVVNRNTWTTTLVAKGANQYPCETGEYYSHPLRIDAAGHVFIPSGPATRLVPDGNGGFAQKPLAPFTESGGVTLSEGGVGGTGWNQSTVLSPVPGRPDYVMVGGDGLYRKAGPGIWGATGRQFAVAVTDAVLVASRNGTQLQMITGALDDVLLAGDPQPADSQRMLDEVNRLRTEASLTVPLLGDARIAQAANNHARYWTLNDPTGMGLNVHHETPGRPGFTGIAPWDRCAFTGTTCGWEVMFQGVSDETYAAAGWMATVYHRVPLVQPGIIRAGGSLIDSMAVLNATDSTGFLGRPVGYPHGIYSGPRSFSSEAPDPGTACRPGSGSAHPPYGSAVSVTLPFTSSHPTLGSAIPDSITVTDSTGQQLTGCLVHDAWIDAFLPDEALKPATTYTARASWSGRFPDYQWTFTTTSEPAKPTQPNPARKKTLRIRLTKLSRHLVRVDANPDTSSATYRLRVQRYSSRWRTIRMLRVAPPKHRALIRLGKPGRYWVTGAAQAGLKAGYSRTITIR